MKGSGLRYVDRGAMEGTGGADMVRLRYALSLVHRHAWACGWHASADEVGRPCRRRYVTAWLRQTVPPNPQIQA